jgi:hypothetical protein
MKKTIYLLTTFLFLGTSVAVLAQQEGQQRTIRSGSIRMLERQIEIIKAQQEKEMAELQVIHKTGSHT